MVISYKVLNVKLFREGELGCRRNYYWKNIQTIY